MTEGVICNVIVVFCQFAEHRCVGRSDVLKTVLSQDLVDVLRLVDVYFSWFLLDMHAQIPGALAFVGHLESLTELGFEFEDCLYVPAK